MRIGLEAPQGWMAEYSGWEPARAWERTVAIAKLADRLRFDSLWVFDHFLTNGDRDNSAPTFEPFATLAALAALTSNVRLGHTVVGIGYRNPALTAKAISSIDVVSGGRAELGVGAGWNESEYRAFGYDYPDTRTRLRILEEGLEIIVAMLRDGRATVPGKHVRADDAINSPRGLQQPAIPVIVGGNGPEVTWRLAARYADELNLDGMSPRQLEAALPTIRRRCEEQDRDPATLRIAVNNWSDVSAESGDARVSLIEAFEALGVARLVFHILEVVDSDEPIHRLAEDAAAAGSPLPKG